MTAKSNAVTDNYDEWLRAYMGVLNCFKWTLDLLDFTHPDIVGGKEVRVLIHALSGVALWFNRGIVYGDYV